VIVMMCALLAMTLSSGSPARAYTTLTSALQWGDLVEWYEPKGSVGGGAAGLAEVMRMEEGRSGDVYALQLLMTRQPTTTEPFQVEIRADDPSGALLATSEPIPASAVPVEPMTAWVVARFTVPPPVTEGRDYAIVLPPRADMGSPDPSYGWISSTEPVGLGATWVGDSAGWSHDAGSWTEDDPVTHRTALVGVTLSLRCEVLFEDGSMRWPDGSAMVGEQVEFQMFDFIPASEVVATLTHRTSGRTFSLTGTHGFGFIDSVHPSHVFGTEDIGLWEVVGTQSDGRPCNEDPRAGMLQISAAPASPDPTPAAPLPNTAVGDRSTAFGHIGIALTATAVMLLALTVRHRRVEPRPRAAPIRGARDAMGDIPAPAGVLGVRARSSRNGQRRRRRR
jgi:hypothetical protein